MKDNENKENRMSHTRRLVTAALFAALCYAMTMLSVPLPVVGYGNLGDCLVLLSGWLLGPLWGAAAAGLGTMLADVTLGYGLYAPATFAIKALMAVAAYYLGLILTKCLVHKGGHILAHLIAAICGEIIMVGGYFAYESGLYDVTAAAGSLIGNSVQAMAGIVLSTALITLIRSNKVLNGFFKES